MNKSVLFSEITRHEFLKIVKQVIFAKKCFRLNRNTFQIVYRHKITQVFN